MAKELDRRVASRIMKSFLAGASRLIGANGGTVQSFDGDRVMGVFVGDDKETNAAKCGLHINYLVREIIKKKFEAKYAKVEAASFAIAHAVGIDTGTVLAVRAGARGANDLIWIGRAPNLAAKLSDLREPPYYTYITAAGFNQMKDLARFGGSPRKEMWETRTWKFLGDTLRIHRSSWQWKP